jgi:glycosyltransferase involved in cell wall biosynthesis
MHSVEVSVVMPCLNEARTLGICIDKALRTLEALEVSGEVVVADNGSTDGSRDIAREHGARVVDVPMRGYGAALMGGIQAASGTYVIMGDADDSYDFTALGPFIEKLREGHDLVVGNRFKGGIKPGAMPPLHRYFGNPVLSFTGRLFFRSPVGDFYCGLRGFSKEAYAALSMRCTGMEFAHEMVVRATLQGLRIGEVPTTLSPDGRERAPHLRTWRDGWRTLRFLLMFSPRWLFLYPGAAMMLVGAMTGLYIFITGTARINSLLLAMALAMMGFQSVLFAVIVRTFAVKERLLPPKEAFRGLAAHWTLERGITAGSAVFLLGIAGYTYATFYWGAHGFGDFPAALTRWVVIPSTFALTLGVQLVLNSFVLSILSLEHLGQCESP